MDKRHKSTLFKSGQYTYEYVLVNRKMNLISKHKKEN